MKPILFAKTATTFTSNGIGTLDPISCKVTEEKNGLFELEMEIAETALHADQIEMTSIIVAKPSQSGSNQAFRVYKLTKPINGRFKVYAQHISYQLSYIPVMPFSVSASASACSQTLAALKTNAVGTCPFNFSTDVTTVASYSQNVPGSLRSRLGGVDGSVLDQFGGEYKWDNYNVYLYQHRGSTTPTVSLRYGKNITDLNQEENIESTITGIVPFWTSSDGETVVTLPEKVIESVTSGNYPFKRNVPYDFSQAFQDEPTQAQLRAKAQAYVNQSGIGIPKVSIKLSFISLADTEEYRNIAALQSVNLCDWIGVYFEKLNISTSAEIVKIVFDVLKEKYDSLEIGEPRSTLASTISSQDGALATLANNTKRMFKQYDNTVGELIDNATAWLTSAGGYVIAVKNSDGSWKELLFMSTNDITDTHANVLRINTNGIGFSSTGIAGPYTQAWTLDGKLVVGGTNVPSLTVYDSSQNILFQIDRNGMQWKAPNSELNTSGTLTIKDGNNHTVGTWNTSGLTMYDGNGTAAGNVIGTWGTGGIDVKKGSIQGASITVGGNNDINGTITVKNASNNTVVSLDHNGMNVSAGTIQGPNIVAGGNNNQDGTISVKNSSNNEVVRLDNTGVNVSAGTITGATIQSAASGSRILMDNTSSLRGYDGSTMHNLINMEQNVSGSHQMTIDADTQLNIRTPNLYVSNQSAGTGTETVYQTVTNNPTGASDSNPDYYLIKNLDKYAESENTEKPSWERWVKTISPEDADRDWDILCTLPVYLKFDKTPLRYINGMLVSGGTSQSVII